MQAGTVHTRALPRLDSLDLLRGFAILGIFCMNVQAMSLPALAYYNPIAYDALKYLHPETYPGLSTLDYAAWIGAHVLVDLKFITVFSMLFGAGIFLQSERLEARGGSPAAVHYLRMAVLLVLGVAHAHLLWYGDVLANYAICGMLIYPLRRLGPSLLIAGGVVMIAVATLYHWASLGNLNISVVNWLRDGTLGLTATTTGNDFEFQAYTGSWMDQMRTRFWVALNNETYSFLSWSLWRCGGAMLVGMGLLHTRFFHAEWPRRAYSALAALLIPTGWAISGLGVLHGQANGWWNGEYPDFNGLQFNYWGSLVTAFGYLCLGPLVVLRIADSAAKGTFIAKLATPLRAVGRTALSNYILQAILGTTLFYGHGFGYFGSLRRVELIPIVLGVWAVQLTLSVLWTRRYAQGPLEWLWHRAVYGILGLRTPAAAGGAV